MKRIKAIKQTANICMMIYRFLKDNADISISVKGEGYAHDLVSTDEGFADGYREDVDLGL